MQNRVKPLFSKHHMLTQWCPLWHTTTKASQPHHNPTIVTKTHPPLIHLLHNPTTAPPLQPHQPCYNHITPATNLKPTFQHCNPRYNTSPQFSHCFHPNPSTPATTSSPHHNPHIPLTPITTPLLPHLDNNTQSHFRDHPPHAGPRGERNREAGGEVEAEGGGRGVMNEGGVEVTEEEKESLRMLSFISFSELLLLS